MLYSYLIILLLALIATWLLTPLIKRWCLSFAWYDHPNGRKVHQQPTPRLGGIAIFFGFWIAVFIGLLIFPRGPEILKEQLGGVFLGSVVVLIAGIYDDLKEISWVAKLLSQAIGTAILIAWGIQIRVAYLPMVGAVQLGYLSIPVTFIWIVALSNTINLIDGLDGLATGVSAIGAVGLALTGILLKIDSVAIVAFGIIGATLGFLRYNWHPAQLFMGDSGSLFLGFLFAALSTICPIKSFTGAALFVPLLALGVPLVETISAIWRRLFTNQKIFVADKRHLFHYLLDSGLTQQAVVWLFYVASFACLFVVICLLTLDRRVIVSALGILYLMLFIALTFLIKQMALHHRSNQHR